MNMNTNTSNPFQVPSCLQRADLQLRRRERFRRGVVVAVAAVVALLIVLLIEGCMSEHAKTATGTITPSPVATQTDTTPASTPAVPESKPVTSPTPSSTPVAAPAATPATTPRMPTPGVTRPQMLYVVKPGDTLGHIARANHTTVKALKDVNGLTSDMISVGAKLKLPSA